MDELAKVLGQLKKDHKPSSMNFEIYNSAIYSGQHATQKITAADFN